MEHKKKMQVIPTFQTKSDIREKILNNELFQELLAAERTENYAVDRLISQLLNPLI